LYIPEDQALYTADTVLGQGTAVFEDLAAYMASLQKMLDFGNPTFSEGPRRYTLLYPGHGPVISDGQAVIRTYIEHRLERENQIIQVLQSSPPQDGPVRWTTWTIVSKIYAAYPESLWLPAAHIVELHLRKLEKEGRVKRLGGEGTDEEWVPL
jgi:glyoxylase-like metal-dependent hydrolase (beta-lactamase superfamily II)